MKAMYRLIGISMALLALSALVFGCSGPERMGLPEEMMNRITMDDSAKANVEVLKHNARRSSTGTVEVWAQLRNKSDKPFRVMCRVQFFDMDGVPAEGFSGWKAMFIQPNSMATYKEFSTKIQEASSYFIEIKGGQ